jgi:tetratricopeptide (TPR) repeat protein
MARTGIAQRRARVALWPLALAVLLLAERAHGQSERRRLAVVALAAPASAVPPAELQRAAAALAGPALDVVGDGVALARAARGVGAVPAATLVAMQRVVEAGAEGWRAYLQVAVPFAASRLGKARSDAEALLPLPGGLELYADLSLRLGAALLSLGRSDEAQDALALALALDPEREVSLVEFSPDVVDAVTRARAPRAALATLTVITPGVTGAVLELDGRRVGAPRPQAGGGERHRLTVSRGAHVVVARRRGYLDAAQAVRVDDAAEVLLPLAPDVLGAALAQVGPGMSEAQASSLVEGVLLYGDADEVLLVAASARAGAPTVLAQRCGSDLRCTAVVELGAAQSGLPAALSKAWAALERGELRYPPGLPSDSRLAPEPALRVARSCRLCRSPWLWATVAAAVAVTSTVLVLTLGQDGPPPILTVDPDDFSRR